jgi:hypothetical protein
MGSVTVAEAVPAGVENFRLYPQSGCHPDVPGWWGFGDTDMSGEELEAWYTRRFGPLNQPISDRLKATSLDPEGPGVIMEFDDLRVSFGVPRPGSMIHLQVLTYETVGHKCPPRSSELWDIDPVTAYTETTATCMNFLGVEYRPLGVVESPPSAWKQMTYEDGRAIAYDDSQPRLIYSRASTDDEWQRNEGRCFRRD